MKDEYDQVLMRAKECFGGAVEVTHLPQDLGSRVRETQSLYPIGISKAHFDTKKMPMPSYVKRREYQQETQNLLMNIVCNAAK